MNITPAPTAEPTEAPEDIRHYEFKGVDGDAYHFAVETAGPLTDQQLELMNLIRDTVAPFCEALVTVSKKNPYGKYHCGYAMQYVKQAINEACLGICVEMVPIKADDD